ncbi:MAG: hypothetical protein GC180_10130 [Bacteroidetes bacterium]|nr:hypothetical protein [Bacteroidota bacterium]
MAVQVKYTPNDGDWTIALPGSKSESNRLAVLQFLSSDAFEITNLSTARDSRILLGCLQQIKRRNLNRVVELDCLDGGTPLRFLMAVCALLPGQFLLRGTARLMKRPMLDLVRSLRDAGADIKAQGTGNSGPWLIQGGKIDASEWSVSMKESSQFASALLLIAPFTDKGVHLRIHDAQASWPYVEMTLKTLSRVGVRFSIKDDGIRVLPGVQAKGHFEVEADWSAAAFFFAAQAQRKSGTLTFPGLKIHSIQGDAFVERIFRYEGIHAYETVEGLRIQWKKPEWNLNPLSLNLESYPDLTPPLLAYYLMEGRAVDWYGLESLAAKESARDAVLGRMIENAGAVWEKQEACWKQRGKCHLQKQVLDTAGDHRMVMAFSLLAMKESAVELDDKDEVNKSFPDFWIEIKKLGIEVLSQ